MRQFVDKKDKSSFLAGGRAECEAVRRRAEGSQSSTTPQYHNKLRGFFASKYELTDHVYQAGQGRATARSNNCNLIILISAFFSG